MNEIDKEIDIFLKKVCPNGKYYVGKDAIKDRNVIHLCVSRGLIDKSVGRNMNLTKKGVKVCKSGGWVKWNRKKRRNKIIYRTITFLGILGGLFFGAITSIPLFSNEEEIKSIEKKEVKQEKLNSNQDSILHEKVDSLTKKNRL